MEYKSGQIGRVIADKNNYRANSGYEFKEDLLLPNKEIIVYSGVEFGGGNGGEENGFIASSELSMEEFLNLVDQLALERTSNLFEFWPDAFYKEGCGEAFGGWWDVTQTANEHT